jgi:uncharacterized RDD family membrane protein YckC
MAEPISPSDVSSVIELSTPAGPAPIKTPYDPARSREWMRGLIALILLIILVAVIVASFYVIVFKPKDQVNEALLEKVLTIVFGPLITLVSAATGFYFGSRLGGQS